MNSVYSSLDKSTHHNRQKCLHFPPRCSHKALHVDKCGRKRQTSERLQSFLLRTNCVYKFLHSSSVELARNSAFFMFRATLSVTSMEAAKRARRHLLRYPRASVRIQTTEAGGLDGGLCLVSIIWEKWRKKWAMEALLVCAGDLKMRELVGLTKIDYNWGGATAIPWSRHKNTST